MYNIIFARNELLFDEVKTAVLLDIFWKLLDFNPEGDDQEIKIN